MRQINGLRTSAAARIMEARKHGPFQSMADFGRRTRLGQATLEQLSRAAALTSLKQDRRVALWQAMGQEKTPNINLSSMTYMPTMMKTLYYLPWQNKMRSSPIIAPPAFP